MVFRCDYDEESDMLTRKNRANVAFKYFTAVEK